MSKNTNYNMVVQNTESTVVAEYSPPYVEKDGVYSDPGELCMNYSKSDNKYLLRHPVFIKFRFDKNRADNVFIYK